MAEIAQRVHPDPRDHAQSDDVESANLALSPNEIKELQTKKRMRRLAYVTALALFLTVVVLVFSLTIMRIRNPKFRIRTINIEHLVISEDDGSPSLDMKFSAEVFVKNTNFGHFKFDEGSIGFFYRGIEVGEASVEKEKARARSTKKMSVAAQVEIGGESSSLENDVKYSGFLTLTSQGKLSGKVHLMKVIKKDKTAEMSCTIVINLAKKVVHNLTCQL